MLGHRYPWTAQRAFYILFISSFAIGLKWPNTQMETFDYHLWEDNGLRGIEGLVSNCIERPFVGDFPDNTTVAAQWLRIAYHDMSTHNVEDGTGGLDASILFELDRPQNIGVGMSASINDFIDITTPTMGLADFIAMGGIMAVAACGGPVIPFRGGRVDALKAGPPTVPEPHQDLVSHTESFKRQGFTQSEMISLVACGHSLGGVRQVDFPTIVPEPVPGFLVDFDDTKEFDNRVVTDYLRGNTTNPLVVSFNETTNSDLRIFSSDKNITMESLASNDNFQKTCANLFERMVNTVPEGVQLTEIVQPIPFKVGKTLLFPNTGDSGTYRFTTSLRVLGPKNSKRSIRLFWKDQQELPACPSVGCSTANNGSFSVGTFMAVKKGVSGFSTYEFNTTIDMKKSVSKFWFEVDEGDGAAPSLVDNDGEGLPIDQTTLLYDPIRSGFFDPQGNRTLNIVAAVRTNDKASTKVSMSAWITGDLVFESKEAKAPSREVKLMSMDSRFADISGYTFFSVNMTNRQNVGPPKVFDIIAEVAGKTVEARNINILGEF